MENEAYESLLLHKVELEKECRVIEQEYYLKFGDSLLTLLKLKLDVAQIKQKIAYCQKQRNQGLKPDEEEMERYAKTNCMDAYFSFITASNKKKEADRCKESTTLNPVEIDKEKRFFRALMKMVHPDMHPEWAKDPLCASIYEHALKAYKQNDLPRLVELYDLARLYFKEDDVEIDGIEVKAAALKEEIEEIETHNPYTYRIYLEDANKGKELMEDIVKQTKEYGAFLKELEGRLVRLLNGEIGEA